MLQIKQGSKIKALFPVFAILMLARCECDEQVSTIPEPVIEILNEAQESSLESDPWLIAGFNTDSSEGLNHNLTLRNAGNGLLKFTSACLVQANSKEDAVENAPCIISSQVPFSFGELPGEGLGMDEAASLLVTYHPEITGPSQLFLRFETNATAEPITAIQLVGPSGQLCGDNIIEFGDVAIGDTKTMDVTLESCGSEPVDVERALFLANPDEVFAVTLSDGGDPGTAGTLNPGEALELKASFAPQDVRLYRDTLAGQYAVETAVPFAAQYGLLLQGNAVPPPSCRLNVVPSVVQFGAVASTESSEQTLILQSVGECACQVTSLEGPVGDEGFELVDAPDLTDPVVLVGTRGCDTDPEIPADAENRLTLTVKYTAPDLATPQAFEAVLTVNSTDETNPSQEVPLQANGGGSPYCQLDVTPVGGGGLSSLFGGAQNRFGIVDFGRVSVHIEKRMPITLTNVGNTTCTISGVEYDYEDNTVANEFSLEYEDGTPVPVGSVGAISLDPTESTTFIALFAPTHTVESGSSLFPSFSFGSYSPNIQEGSFSGTVSGYCASSILSNADKCNGVKFITNDTVTTETVDDIHQQGEFSIGFSATPVEPAIDVIPGELDFGLVTVGCGSPEQRVTVYNTGSGDLIIGEPTIDPVVNPEEFVVTATNNPTGTWPYTIQPGASMSIMVRFYARFVGAHYANVVIPTFEGGQEGPSFSIPVSGEGTLETSAEDIFEQLTDPKVDVLWVVDDSGSMDWVQDELADNFDEFFSSSNVEDADYHIAVTTTLTTDGNCIGGFGTQTCPVDEMCGHYTACSGNDRFLTNTSATPENQFRCNVKVSDNVNPSRPSSDSAEGALQAARYFLSPPKIDDPAANGGFLREDAKLHIIAVSDEEDQSEGPIDLYVDFFRNLKGFRNDSLIAFSAIAAPDGGCDSIPGDARYETVVSELNGRFQSICDDDWTSMMQNLGLDSLGLQIEFFLSRAADPATLSVYVTTNGQETEISQSTEGSASGYFYDATSNSIVFNPQSIPERGSTIRVVYETFCF